MEGCDGRVATCSVVAFGRGLLAELFRWETPGRPPMTDLDGNIEIACPVAADVRQPSMRGDNTRACSGENPWRGI
jgi:hypothetical protein